MWTTRSSSRTTMSIAGMCRKAATADFKEKELEEMKKRLQDIEEEAGALREMQAKVEKEMNRAQELLISFRRCMANLVLIGLRDPHDLGIPNLRCVAHSAESSSLISQSGETLEFSVTHKIQPVFVHLRPSGALALWNCFPSHMSLCIYSKWCQLT